MALKASGEFLPILLGVADDLLRGLLELNSAVRNHATRSLNTLSDAVQHRRVYLVIILLQVLGRDAPHAQLVIR